MVTAFRCSLSPAKQPTFIKGSRARLAMNKAKQHQHKIEDIFAVAAAALESPGDGTHRHTYIHTHASQGARSIDTAVCPCLLILHRHELYNQAQTPHVSAVTFSLYCVLYLRIPSTYLHTYLPYVHIYINSTKSLS